MILLAPGDYLVLLEIFLFLAVAQFIRIAAQKVGFPEIVADLLAGMILGAYALGGVVNGLLGVPIFGLQSGLLLFADLSVVLLLFSAGLGAGVTSLRRAGIAAVGAAIAGDLLAFGITFAVFSRFYPTDSALFLGVAAAATSAAVSVSLLRSEQLGGTPGVQLFLHASALDDVVALVLLSSVTAYLAGSQDPLRLTGTVVTSVVAWVVLLVASVVIIPRLLRWRVLARVETLPFTILFVVIAIVLALGFSPIIGAYVAGLAVAESVAAPRTRLLTEVLVGIFGALFFIVVGAEFEAGLLRDPLLLGFALLLAATAAVGKFAGVYPFARQRLHDDGAARAIAAGMIPRGEIGLLVGSIGFASGFLSETMLGEVVLMSIFTTLIGSLLFRHYASHLREDPREVHGSTMSPVVR